MREHLNPETQVLYDRHFGQAIKGGCDVAQAHSIAREKTLIDVMSASAAISATRQRLQAYRE